MADHNHDPTPQVRMVMPIAPKGRLHSHSLEAKQIMIFLKRKFVVPLALEQLSLHHDSMKFYCILKFRNERELKKREFHGRKKNILDF